MSQFNPVIETQAANVTLVSADFLGGDTEGKALFDRIESRESLIVLSWPSSRLAEVLAASIDKRTSHGKNSAILSETIAEKGRVADLVNLLQAGAEPFGCRSFERRDFLARLDSTTEEKWFDHLDVVLIPRTEDSLLRPFEWEHLCYRIHDRCVRRGRPTPQLLLICSPRDHAEGALRRNFPIFDLNAGYALGAHLAHEKTFCGENVGQLWWTLWAAEDAYERPLISPTPDVEYGVEILLGYYLGLRRVSPSRYQTDRETPIEDQLESLQHRLSQEGKPAPEQILCGNPDGYFVRDSRCSGKSIRDPASNPWRALRALSEKGGKALLVNLVLPPTMLRGYLIANAHYFRSHPLEPLTPRMMYGIFDCVTQIYLRLSIGGRISLNEVRDILEKCEAFRNKGVADPFTLLRTLFTEAFGKSLGNRLQTKSEVQWLAREAAGNQGERFERKTWVVLGGDGLRSGEVDWLKELEVHDERTNDEGGAVEAIRGDHVYQTYIPGQNRTLSGKLFRIESVDANAVRIRKTTGLSALYRQSVSVRLMTDPLSRSVLQRDVAEGPGFRFRRDVFEIAFNVSVKSWWSSTDFGIHWRRSGADSIKDRVYRPGRALRILLTDRDDVPLWTASQRLALAQWMNESSVTLFPESHRFMIAAAHVSEEERPTSKPSCEIAPKLSFSVKKAKTEDSGALWIFEDSHADLGIVGAGYDRAEWLLNLCLDYLNWRLDEIDGLEQSPAPCLLNRSRLTADFLAYGAATVDPAFDFAGLRDCLRASGLIAPRQSLTEARRQSLEDSTDVPGLTGDGALVLPDGSGPQCDICQTRVEGEQGQLLSDGRFRCLACSANAVDRLEEAQKICGEILELLRSEFRVEFRQPVSVQFVDASRIAVENGETFVPTSDFDVRAVGLAVAGYSTSSGRQFTIFVEHGHSREDTAMTFAHEFTHIWQYERLDYCRMEEDHGKLLIEGHASWAELACGRTLAKRAAAGDRANAWRQALEKRETDLLRRQDEYGRGYRLLLDMLGEDIEAFGLLEKMYGQ
jgi:hypothetical protein